MAENKTKKERQFQILEAAMEVFVSNGYANTRMDDIVTQSGLSKGALYHHYPSKKDLFIALIDHWEVYCFPDFYSRNGAERTASETLFDFARAVLDVFKEKKYVFLAEVEFWALSNQDDEINERSKSLYKKLLNLFELVLQKGIRTGEFKEVDTKAVSLIILTCFQGINWFCIFGEDQVSPETYIEESMNILIKSIKK
ncbi:MAG: TetR/AcrR family transcriptional regulator [Candidatus Marinimicrobia bacterium]|nr:TetR/AcrR family transcriptional regulator [Candidatus Neomarinimicrobiota bacterium]